MTQINTDAAMSDNEGNAARDIVKVVYQISQKVMSITDDELQVLQKITDEQKNYINPLKCAKTARIQAMAEHNQKIIDLIKELRDLLLTDKDLPNGGNE